MSLVELARQQLQSFLEHGKESQSSGATLRFEDMQLTEIPAELVATLEDAKVEIAKLSFRGNLLRTVPSLDALKQLYYLDLSHNMLTRIPNVLCECENLKILDLSHNAIASLPARITQLKGLQVLSLKGNRVEVVPPLLLNLPALAFVELEDNPLLMPPASELEKVRADDTLEYLREYITANRSMLLNVLERSISQTQNAPQSPETVASSRQTKRLGFVMQKNPVAVEHSSPNTPGRNGEELPEPPRTPETPNSLQSFVSPTSQAHQRGSSTEFGGVLSSPGSLIRSPQKTSSPSKSQINLPPPAMQSGSVSPGQEIGLMFEKMDNLSVSFKRLSTLDEEDSFELANHRASPPPENHADHDVITKLVVSSSEFCSGLVKCTAACSDKTLCSQMTHKLQAVRSNMNQLSSVMEESQSPANLVTARQLAIKCIESMIETLTFLNLPQIFESFSRSTEIRAFRSLILQTYSSYADLQNALVSLNSSNQIMRGESVNLSLADDQLYLQLNNATKTSQTVLSLLTNVVSKSALESTTEANNATLALKVRDLSNSCVAGVAATRRLRQVLNSRPEHGIADRKKFVEDINGFLKVIIAILGATKSALDDLPLLAEIGTEISTLAKLAKEIPPLLEQSSFNLSLGQSEATPRNLVLAPPPLLSNGNTSNSPSLPPPTPLTATLGNVAQALVSPTYNNNSPFFSEASKLE